MTEPLGRVQPGDDPDFMLALGAHALRLRALRPLVSTDPADPFSRRNQFLAARNNVGHVLARHLVDLGRAPEDVRRLDAERALRAASGALAVQVERCLPEKLDSRSYRGVKRVGPVSDRALVAAQDFCRAEVAYAEHRSPASDLLAAFQKLADALTTVQSLFADTDGPVVKLADEPIAKYAGKNGTQNVLVTTTPGADLPVHDVLTPNQGNIMPRSKTAKKFARQLREVEGKPKKQRARRTLADVDRELAEAEREGRARARTGYRRSRTPLTPAVKRSPDRLKTEGARHSVVTQRTGEGICSCGFASNDRRLVVAHLKGV